MNMNNAYTIYLEEQLKTPATGYIFSGPVNLGKKTLAMNFASALLCNSTKGKSACEECTACTLLHNETHPDFHQVYLDEGKLALTIEQIHNLIITLRTKASVSSMSVVLINNADVLNISAANALLKILEEPKGKTVFILLDNKGGSMLSTIQSRCQQLTFTPQDQKAIFEELLNEGVNKEKAEKVALLSKGAISLAKNLVNDAKLFKTIDTKYMSVIDSITSKVSAASILKSVQASWSEKQIDAQNILADYKYIWHNILLYKLGLDTYIKTYHNQDGLSDYIESISLENIVEKITDITNADKALKKSVPGNIILESIV